MNKEPEDILETPRLPEAPPGSPERALVLVPVSRSRGKGGKAPSRDAAARVEEAAGLAHAIDLDVVEAFAVPLGTPTPATLLGSGKVAELGKRITDERIGLVVVDGVLSPAQQRNLEKAWKAKVIDRTGLILEIFGERAHTSEGTLQVELAHLNYQKSRLVRSWTHLERQRGGFGFLGGPGETQIEADRRALEERIARIEKDLETVATRRRLQRKNRRKSGEGLVALVGYTNAGKSTLFNALTQAGVFADNRLFATLDPTLRKIDLPHGSSAVISDTVGFVSELPTTLVAAFRATLEEVVEVWNKIDRLPPEQRPPRMTPERASGEGSAPAIVAVSALTGEGLPELLDLIEQRLSGSRRTYTVELTGAALGDLHKLYEIGEVIDRSDRADGATVASVRVSPDRETQFRTAFPDAKTAI